MQKKENDFGKFRSAWLGKKSTALFQGTFERAFFALERHAGVFFLLESSEKGGEKGDFWVVVIIIDYYSIRIYGYFFQGAGGKKAFLGVKIAKKRGCKGFFSIN
jgi:hypothetical protein